MIIAILKKKEFYLLLRLREKKSKVEKNLKV